MRSPQPVMTSGVRLRSPRVNSFKDLRRWCGRRVKSARGDSRNASVMGDRRCLPRDAVVLGVAMVRVKDFEVEPGGTMGGLNEALARFGSPVAARVMGLEMFPCS